MPLQLLLFNNKKKKYATENQVSDVYYLITIKQLTLIYSLKKKSNYLKCDNLLKQYLESYRIQKRLEKCPASPYANIFHCPIITF